MHWLRSMPSDDDVRSVPNRLPDRRGSSHAQTKRYHGNAIINNHNSTILIVDDEPNVRLVFRTALDLPGNNLIELKDGQDALDWLAGSHADLVLLDLQMPGIPGMEVLRRLRAVGKDVPVVVITAHGGVPSAVEAMKLGAIDFLSKPLTPEALRRVVTEVLERHDRRDAPPPDLSASQPPPPRDLLTSAKRAINHRLFARAEVLLRREIADRPESAEPWYLLGVLREVQQRPRAAQEAYRKALEIVPGYEPARFHLMKFPCES
jgi:DNA-binding response OmpR family regulator